MRPTCTVCNQRSRAIAYHRNDKIYYRSKCESCIKRNKKIKTPIPRWKTAGYKKKPACDRCGFKAKYNKQLLVFHTDGNLHNTSLDNLKTICLNCTVDISRAELPWKPEEFSLTPDFY